MVTLQKDAKIRELEDEICRLSKLVEESGSSSADLLQQNKGAVARIEELEEELRREKLANSNEERQRTLQAIEEDKADRKRAEELRARG